MSRILYALVAVTIVPLSCAFAQGHHAHDAQPPNPQVEPGRKAFVQSCGFCHGEDAAGSRAPDLIRSSLVNHDKEGDLIGPMIRNGRPDKGMPAFPASSLSNDQLAAIVVFLHTRVTEASRSAHVSNDYPLEKLLTGNAEAGKAYFYGAGKCSECHSPDKDLKNIASRFQPLNLQQRFLYPQRPDLDRTAIITLATGQEIKGVLVHLDDFSVAIRDSDGWYRSWPCDAVKVTVHDPLEEHRKLLSQYTDADVHNLFAYLETLK